MANDPRGGCPGSKFSFMLSELRSGKPGALLRRELGVPWSILSADGKAWEPIPLGPDAPDSGIDLGDVHDSRPLMDSEIEALIAKGMPSQ